MISHTHENITTVVLCGGKSSRMGCDKLNLIRPDGRKAIDYIISLINSLNLVPTLSLAHRLQRPGYENFPLLLDDEASSESGPLTVLYAALNQHPGEAVLLIAGDLLLLDAATINDLLAHGTMHPVCYENRLDHKHEPLCALYPASCLPLLTDFLTSGGFCARKFMRLLNPHVLTLKNICALDNINTQYDWLEAQEKLVIPAQKKNICIHYYAMLREARGCETEQHVSHAHTAAGLYAELAYKHRLHLSHELLRVVKNNQFTNWHAAVCDGDDFIFMQPFAGG